MQRLTMKKRWGRGKGAGELEEEKNRNKQGFSKQVLVMLQLLSSAVHVNFTGVSGHKSYPLKD